MIGALVVGLIAGALARAIMPGQQNIGILGTLLVGIIGGVVGWFIFTGLFGIGDSRAFDFGSLPGAIVGALIVLWVWQRLASTGAARRV